MADNGRWFKLWCSAVFDQELDNLPVADFGRWCKLGAYVKEHGKSGKIILKSPQKTLCSALQIQTFDDLILTIQTYPNIIIKNETDKCVSFSLEFANWRKYQENLSTDRVHKFRENETPKKRGEERRREKKRKEEKHLLQSAEKKPQHSTDWPEEDRWLFDFLTSRDLFTRHGYDLNEILNYPYWDNVSTIVNGLSQSFLEPEFAKMSTWIEDNKNRKPTQKGLRRFIKGWLERAYEKERKYKT